MSVDIPTKHVDVTYDPSLVSPSAIVARLDEEGYPVAGYHASRECARMP